MFPSFSRRGSDHSSRSSSSSDYDSQSSKSTSSSVPNSVPSLDHHSASELRFDTPQDSALFDSNPCTSVNTYCTTVASYDNDNERRNHDIYDAYDDSEFFFEEPPQSAAVPATPQEFADHFPSTKRLIIKHDDSTLDGNMNVRVDCEAPTRREHDRRITLFHLRMYDLRDRDFSIRRYGRDCGREVAHIKRKFVTAPTRPTLRKALSSFRGKHEQEEFKKIERVDSGYASNFDDDEEEAQHAPSPPAGSLKATNSCTLEFSNYAHVELTRRGVKSAKRYEFEYWGKSYSWRRTIKGAGMNEDVSYQLVNNATSAVVAEIRPDPLTAEMAAMEDEKGGFVPPSSMYIYNSTTDPVNSGNADVAE
jgi:hypothetical protein